ncbi:MAG: rRNA pseudouridine synthase [Treponema sp.]|nr:rRNA pseudouridine synthase [Treponema sp.]
MERIDKLLAHEGLGSRKDIKKLLRISEVLVNGKRIFDAGTQIDIDADVITIDGEEIDLHDQIYLMMNKIMHTVSSNKDGEHQTVFDLLDDDFHTPYLESKLHLIGRLDMDTEGLLLFTTNGELTHRVTSPKTHISKTYFVILEHAETEEHKIQIEQLFQKGIEVGPEDNESGFVCEPAKIQWANEQTYKKHISNSSFEEALSRTNTKVENPSLQAALLTITEGKYHQVKRMFAAVNNKVAFLKRVSMGNLNLDETLEPGAYRLLSDDEVELLETNDSEN